MTGNTVRFFIYGAEAFNFYLASKGYVELYPEKAGKPKHYEETMKKYSQELAHKFQLFCWALGPFCTGAVVGVPMAEYMGFWSFFVPMLCVAFLLWSLWMARRQEMLLHPEKYINVIEEHATTVSPMFAMVEAGQRKNSTASSTNNNHSTHDKDHMNSEVDYTQLSERTEDTDETGDESPPGSENFQKYSLFKDGQSATGELSGRNMRRHSSVCEMGVELHGL